MAEIKYSIAAKKDRKQLLNWFRHYGSQSVIERRVDCYLSHNFTVVAKDKNRIIGVLQWYSKEEPDDGVAEIEELFISEDYRGRGIGFNLINYAVQSIIDYFKLLKEKPRRVYLFVSEKNKIARKVYEKLGFRKMAKVGNLFHDKEPELFYTLKL